MKILSRNFRSLLKIGLALMLLVSNVSLAQLTKEDIRQIVKEENVQLEARLKEYVDLKINALKADVDLKFGSLKSDVDLKFGSLKAEVEAVKWMLTILIVVIVAVLALPQAVSFIRERRELREVAELRERLTRLEQKLQTISTNIPVRGNEELKQ